MFGQNKTFGSSSFGNNSNTGSNLFGQQAKPSLFGQTTTNNAGSNIFGQQKPAGSLFGSTTTQPQTSSLFGSPAQTNTSTSIFGNANKPMFGSTTTTNTASTGLFGSSTNTNTGGSLFGSSTTNTGGNLFGSTTSTTTGTSIKFDPPVAPDTMVRNGSSQSISTKHMCISAMKQYETKSLEELRIEDYIAKQKTPQAGTTSTGGGLFGSSTSTTGTSLFGNTNNQQQKSLFGSTPAATSSPFGGTNTSGTGTSLFGSKPATGGSLFGSSTNTGTSTFGSNTGTSLFGNNNATTTNAFGASQPAQQTGSLFGNTSNTGTSLFGNTQAAQPQQQQSSFTFGSNTGTTFGQPVQQQTGGLFGNTTANNNTGTSLFGKPAQTTGFSFGSNNNTTSTFGQPAANTSGGLFGNTAAKPGGLFGNTGTTTTGGGLFGSTQPATGGGLFGNTAAAPAATGFGAQPTVIQQQQPVQIIQTIGVPADVAQMQSDMKMLEAQLKNSPYGNSPLLKYIKPKAESDEKQKDGDVESERQRRYLASVKSVLPTTCSSKFITNLVPKAMSDLTKSPANTTHNTSKSETAKDLNYTSKILPPTLGKGLGSASRNVTLNNSNVSALNTSKNQSLNLSTRKENLKYLSLSACGGGNRTINGTTNEDPDALQLIPPATENPVLVNETADLNAARNVNRQVEPIPLNLDRVLHETSNVTTAISISTGKDSSTGTPVAAASPQKTSKTVVPNAAGVTITKQDYYCFPSIEELKGMVVDGKVVVKGLTIGRSSYGNVFWPGRVVLSDVALDELVVFRHKEVTVYPVEEEKPEEGQGLNQPAEVTLERVWFVDKKSKEEVRDPLQLAQMGWRDHLERATIRMGASFKDYRADSGSWVFRVEHFSKYGLLDDDDVDMEALPSKEPQNQKQKESPKTVQDSVQRVPIAKGRVPPPQRLSDLSTPVTIQVGLGGGLTQQRCDGLDASTFELQDDEYQNGGNQEEFEVPEKKPKLELLENLDFESSRFLSLAIQEDREAPKCVPPVHAFVGGRPAKETIGYRKSELIDLAITKGNFAPVGWSGVGSFVWSQQPNSNDLKLATIDLSVDTSPQTLSAMISTNIRLAWSESAADALTPHVGYDGDHSQIIDAYTRIAREGGDEAHLRLWTLCDALFPVNRENGWQFDRAERLGDWLRDEAKRHAKHTLKDTYSLIWHELTIGAVDQAFRLASEAGKTTLASALAIFQVTPEDTTGFFRRQIDAWEKSRCMHTLPDALLKIYLVLGGFSNKSWTIDGKKRSVNCLEELHWSQALGIHMWYLRQWAGIADAYESYTEDVAANRAAGHAGDLYAELIKLAAQPQASVELVLDCCDSAKTPNDVYLRWHLCAVLLMVGFKTADPGALQRLHQQYAEQLAVAAEASEVNMKSLLKFAFFVLQHIDCEQGRVFSIQSLLDRSANFISYEEHKEIAKDRGIPSAWVAAARLAACQDLDEGILFELAVQAEDLPEAHRLFVEDVAPNAVLTDDLDSLQTACSLLEPFADAIPEWGSNGQVYVEFLKLKSLEESEEPDLDLVLQIESRLDAPVFKKHIQRLSMQTMARVLHEYKRTLLPEEPWSTRVGARQLRKQLREMTSYPFECHPITFG